MAHLATSNQGWFGGRVSFVHRPAATVHSRWIAVMAQLGRSADITLERIASSTQFLFLFVCHARSQLVRFVRPPLKRLTHQRDDHLKACRRSCGGKHKRSAQLPDKRLDDLHAETRLYQRIVISRHTDACIRDRQGQNHRIAVQIDADGRLAVHNA